MTLQNGGSFNIICMTQQEVKFEFSLDKIIPSEVTMSKITTILFDMYGVILEIKEYQLVKLKYQLGKEWAENQRRY